MVRRMVVTVLALAFCASAAAHPYPRPKTYPFTGDLQARKAWQAKALRHARRDARELTRVGFITKQSGVKRSMVPKLERIRKRERILKREIAKTDRAITVAEMVAEPDFSEPAAVVPASEAYSGDHFSLWLCIHNGEADWADPNAPYFGGLQMGYWFMETYGDLDTYGRDIYAEEGTADNWSEAEQIAVAEAAFAEEGYSTSWLHGQWPTSSLPCT